jgi:hypothetical protein
MGPGLGARTVVFHDPSRVLDVVETTEAPTSLPPQGTCIVNLETRAVTFSAADSAALNGKVLFLRAGLAELGLAARDARLVSFASEPYALTGSEEIEIVLGNQTYAWSAAGTTGSFLARDLAGLIAPSIPFVAPNRGKIEFRTTQTQAGFFAGTLRVGDKTSLGFARGWEVSYLPGDSQATYSLGLGLSLVLSPESELDITWSRQADEKILAQIPASSFALLPKLPLRDLPSAATGQESFYVLPSGALLQEGKTVDTLWAQPSTPQVRWARPEDQTILVQNPTTQVPLPLGTVPSSLQLQVSEDGQPLGPTEDFALVDEGTALALTQSSFQSPLGVLEGGLVTSGSIFSHPALPGSAQIGDFLLLQDALWTITGVGPGTVEFASGGAVDGVWTAEVLRANVGEDGESFALRADVVYVPFSPLGDTDPFIVRILTLVGGQGASNNPRLRFPLQGGQRLRMGLPFSSPRRELQILDRSSVGRVGSGTPVLPAEGITYITQQSYELRLGSAKTLAFSEGTLVQLPAGPVPSPIPPGVAVVLLDTREVFLAEDLLSQYAELEVIFAETFLPSGPASGFVEVDPDTQGLSFSPSDLVQFSATPIYAENTLASSDWSLSPLLGSFSLVQPLLEGQIAEAQYLRADSQGALLRDAQGAPIEIVEFLPNSIRQERATFLAPKKWAFNPSGKTFLSSLASQVYLDGNLCNIGTSPICTVKSTSTIDFRSAASSPASIVKITYQVLEASGGETNFTVSSGPIWRPGLVLPVGASSFSLQGDQASLFPVGAVVRVAASLFYSAGAAYDATTGETTILLAQSVVYEAGSRDLSAPTLSLVSSVPLQDLAGFWRTRQLTVDAPKGATSIIAPEGPWTPGLVLEVGGSPYAITDVSTVELGQALTLGSPLTSQGAAGDEIRISVRPIYAEGQEVLLGLEGPPVGASEVFVRTGSGQGPAKRDFGAQVGQDSIRLGVQGGLSATSQVFIRATWQRQIPAGSILELSYRVAGVPSFAAQALYGKFYYEAPDAWFFQVRAEEALLPTVLGDLEGTGTLSLAPEVDNTTVGERSLRNEQIFVEQKDRIAKRELHASNLRVTRLEGVLESLKGYLVGAGSGRWATSFLRSFSDPTAPGYEETFGAATRIPLDMSYVVQTALGLVGAQSPILEEEIGTQAVRLATDDLDDLVQGSALSVPSKDSRAFPLEVGTFFETAPGPYGSNLRQVLPTLFGIPRVLTGTTFGKPIAQMANPVVGAVGGVTTAQIRDRRPVAFVVAYSSTGFPQYDQEILAAGKVPFGLAPRPAVLLSLVPPRELILGASGLPQASQFQTLPNLDTGREDLQIPPFRVVGGGVLPRPYAGVPEETGIVPLCQSGQVQSLPIGTGLVPAPIYVGDILLGFIVTFLDASGNPLTQAPVGDGGPLRVFSAGELLVPGAVFYEAQEPPSLPISNPPTEEEKALLLSALPSYRIGQDVGLSSTDGKLLDATLPSFFATGASPLGLMQLVSQRPPQPLSKLEAVVELASPPGGTEPLTQLPALVGTERSDDGDLWPYSPPRGEAQLWSELQSLAFGILAKSPEPGELYPDEVRTSQARVLAGPSGPGNPGATFLTGAGDLSPLGGYDLVLVQTPQPNVPQGTTGVLQVASVEGDTFLLPRFVSPTSPGARIRYRFDAAMACVNQPATDSPAGIRVTVAGLVTTLAIDPAVYVILNDGSLLPQGGLNAIFDPPVGPWPWPNNANIVRINLFSPSDGTPATYIQTITLDVGSGVPVATGNVGTQAIAALPQALLHSLTVQTAAPFVSMAFVPGPGQLPEDPLNPGTSLPLQFTIDIDTSAGGAPLAPAGSWTGSIDADRLTFREALDLRTVRPASEPPMDGQLVHGRLNVVFVEGPLGDTLTCNSMVEINGGLPLTFIDPTPPQVFIGTFEGGEGTARVPSVQGFGNSAVAFSDGRLTALPTSSWDKDSPILRGTGEMESGLGFELYNNRILAVLPSAGSLEQVEAGDTIVVSGSNDPTKIASSKVGTYLVYQGIQPDVGQPFKEFAAPSPTLPLGSETLLHTLFPDLVSISLENVGAETLVVSEVEIEGTVVFPQPTGNLYLVRDPSDLTQTLVLPYTGLDAGTKTFHIDPTGLLDSGGAPISPSVLSSLPTETLIAGATKVFVDFAAVQFRQSTVGHLGDGNTSFGAGGSALGLRTLEISSPPLGVDSFLLPYAQVPAPPDTVVVGPALAGQVSAVQRVVTPPGQFQADPTEASYETVARFFDLARIDPLVWDAVHSGLVPALATLLPGDVLSPTMRVQGGVYLEPSTPRSCLNLGDGIPKIVDAGHSLPSSYVGVRSGLALGNPTGPEPVAFEVRRTRRFSQGTAGMPAKLQEMGELLQERTATIVSYGGTPEWPYGVLTTSGTDWTRGGVRPGDEIEVLGVGEVSRIAKIADANTLWILAPGLPSAAPGLRVTTRLHALLLPQVQACNELLDVVVDVVLERGADLSLGQGGYVPLIEPGVNDLLDTDGTKDFLALGVLPEDYLVIDPAGPLVGPGGQVPSTGQEHGARPFGDLGIPARPDAHVPLGTSELDDNRGFYRITGVTQTAIRTSEVSVVSGAVASPVTVSGDYALLPTVSGSASAWAVNGAEAQQVLRPTAFAGMEGSPPNSFLGNLYSIAPFSYKVVRPKEGVDPALVEWVLFLRERALSLLDKVQGLQRRNTLGTWRSFQELEQIANPLDLGVWSNDALDEILGLWSTAPFSNWKDALSALDRRVAALDLRLDTETPPGEITPYTDFSSGDQRPTVSDQIEALLGQGLRARRVAWLRYRANLATGLLAQIRFLEARIQASARSNSDLKSLV